MSVPDREKISEKLIKEWESLEDEVIIKEVATKGKYIKLAQQFLARRNDKSVSDIYDYFHAEVDKYVNRLLSNRQVHKAELVLTNVGRQPQIIFYEFIQSSSKEHIDEDIKECVLEHIQKCSETFEQVRDEYDYYLLVLRLVMTNKMLKRSYEKHVPQFTLENLYRNDELFRKKLAIATCFQCRNASLIDQLERHLTWEYLLQNGLFHYLVKWLDLRYESQLVDSDVENKPEKKEFSFDVVIRNQFLSWDIEPDMFEMINEPAIRATLKDFVLHSLAKNGVLLPNEQNDILKIMHRILTTESYKQNAEWLLTQPNLLKIVQFVCDQDELGLLADKIFPKNILMLLSSNYSEHQRDIELCASLKDVDFEDPIQLAAVSSHISTYIAETSDTDFYQKFPFVYLAEHFLRNNDLSILANSDEAKAVVAKVSFLNGFMHKLTTKLTYCDYDVTLADLIHTKNINLNLVRSEMQSITNPIEDVPKEMISFSNQILSQKYSISTTLGYLHYIKQHRSSYAAYHFFIDQLRNYSQISRSQIQVICSSVSELAVNNLNDRVLLTHCIAFIEMLGVNTLVLRSYLKCLQIIQNAGMEIEISESETIARTKEILLRKMKENQYFVDPVDMEAIKIFLRSKNLEMPIEFLKMVASDSSWFHFLLFASQYGYSIRAMINVCQMDCFGNRNIGLNVGRALKEIIADDEMPLPKRTASFSYREHKKKIQSKNESSQMINSVNRALTTSLSLTDSISTKFVSSQYLNINDDQDMFAIILLCTVENGPVRETTLNVKLLKDLMKNTDVQQTATYLNLLRFAFKLKWPMLAIVAAMANDSARDYCWAAWIIISMGVEILNNDLKTLEQLSRKLIVHSIKENFVRTLNLSMQIFYPESGFKLFTGYLADTSLYDFSFDVIKALQTYLNEVNENNVTLSCLTNYHRDQMMDLTISILVEYVSKSFDSAEHRQLLLESLCASGISDYTSTIDFCMIKTINKILCFTSVELNIEALLRSPSASNISDSNDNVSENVYMQLEYQRICNELCAEKSFAKAMEIADLLCVPKDNIVYESWIHAFKSDANFCLDTCECEAEEMALSPLLLLSFLLFIADELPYEDPKKYKILKKALDAIKKHHLRSCENVNRDRIEYDLVMCFLRNSQHLDEQDMYHSEYFEAVMSVERYVLYKSFMNLKQMAGVDELTVLNREPLNNYELGRLEELMNTLLDKGDVVQALRLQAMFNHRTLDLHYLVFCMALAEGLASLYELSVEQRQMLNDGAKNAASKFNRRTLRLTRVSQSSSSSSPNSRTYMEALENAKVDFDDVSSREKQDLLEAIQSLASRVKHGFKLAQRIAMAFRSAIYLDKEYLDVLKTKDPFVLLHSAINDECLNRLLVMSDIITSMHMTRFEIAEFMSEQIAKAIIKSRFYLFQNSMSDAYGQNYLWGYDLDKEFHLFLELCPNTTMLGTHLMKYCDVLKIYRKYDANKNTEPEINGPEQNIEEMRKIFNNLRQIMENQVLSHKKQNMITVELLIKAHDCFVHECSMEGIANVLHRCKNLANTLATAKSWHMIVRMLMGVGRYRDMYYCFEKLIKNEQFESLLGQFDEERSNGLKEAIIAYLHENYPDDKENYRLAALHFQMYKELAHLAETEARVAVSCVLIENEIKVEQVLASSTTSISCSRSDFSENGNGSEKLVNGYMAFSKSGLFLLKCKKRSIDRLLSAIDSHAHAAENYLLENKLGLAQRAASNAELTALQVNLLRVALDDSKDTCIGVLNVRSEHTFRYLVNYELSVPQALILSRAYPYEINWTEAIFNQFIIQNTQSYMDDYNMRMELTEDMIEVIVKSFMQLTSPVAPHMEQNISTILDMVESVTVKYKLASLLSDKRIIANLINDQSIYYLKDTNYGRNEGSK